MHNNILARLLVAGLFLVGTGASAQRYEVGGALGGMLYKGDVAPSLNPRFYRPGGGVFFRYHVSRSLALRTQLALGQVAAADRLSRDPFQQARNYEFRTNLAELTLDAQYKFRNFAPLRNAKNWTPYLFGGIGFMTANPQVGRRRMHPLGVGVQYEFRRPWSIGVEFGTRFTRTDLLDNLGPAQNTAKLQQGNPTLKDHYTFTAITLSYTFYQIFCPEPRVD